MEDVKIKICRLCLKIIEDECFNGMAHIEIINNIVSEVNLDLSSEADLCKACFLKLKEFSIFKSTCLKNNEYVINSINTEITATISLEDLILSKLSNDGEFLEKICRLCLKGLTQESSIKLENIQDNSLSIIMAKCIPEINISLTFTPVSCTNCMNSLQNLYAFIKNCLDTEQKIYSAIGNLGKANLFQVFQYYLVKGDKTQTNEIKLFKNQAINLINKIELKCEENDQLTKAYHDEPELVKKEDIVQFNLENEIFDSNINVQSSIKTGSEATEIYRLSNASKKRSVYTEIEMMIVYKCDQCTFLSNSKEDTEAHLTNHDNPGIVTTLYQCNQCPYKAVLLRNLKKHLIKHKDPSEVKMYSCNQCTYQSKYKSGLVAHIVSHKNPEELEMRYCDQCSFQTKLKDRLRKHRVIHKSNYKVKSFPCDLCSYIAKERSRLKQHMLIHMNENEIEMFRCQHCPYSSKHKSALVTHMAHHQNPGEVRLRKCDDCSYETRFKSHLQRHKESVHSGGSSTEKFQCCECPYQAKNKSNLSRHMFYHKIDNQVLYHQCDMCTYKTRKKGTLVKHKLSHLSKVFISDSANILSAHTH